MGIRFYCPNGHKLNVKTFQAGQTGICPVCGAKMQIPLESTRPSSREQRRNAPVTARVPSPADGPRRVPATSAAGAAGATAADPPGGQNQQTAAPPPRAAAARAAADPLAAEATWYVRPATGGQFGPATSEIMRIWLAEGRIAADTLVWRDGWRDWQEAQRVFRQPPPNGVVDGPNADHSVPIGGAEAPLAPGQRRQAESPPNARRMLVTVGVVVGLVVLGVVAVLLAFFLGHR